MMAFLPVYTKRFKISFVLPILALGMLLYFFDIPLAWSAPFDNIKLGKFFSEIIVIISLMVAGLKIGTSYNINTWKVPFKLVGITMPISILLTFLLGVYLLNLSYVNSFLIAAVLAPTDPVLASGLQLEDYKEQPKNKDGLRFALTGEAAINDGMAFPFIYIAILWSNAHNFDALNFKEIVGYYFFYKILVGLTIGFIIGVTFSYILSRHVKEHQLKITNSFLALALTFVSYGIAEIAQTYGFLAVFATGVGLQFFDRERSGKEKSYLLSYIEKTEELLALIWALFFGGAIISGLMNFADLKIVLFSLIFVIAVRPLTGILALIRTPCSKKKKWAIAFLGIKGIGSFFYLFFALINGNFNNHDKLITITACVVLMSILIHGIFSRRVVDYFH